MAIAYFDPKIARGSDRGRCLRAQFQWARGLHLSAFHYSSRLGNYSNLNLRVKWKNWNRPVVIKLLYQLYLDQITCQRNLNKVLNDNLYLCFYVTHCTELYCTQMSQTLWKPKLLPSYVTQCWKLTLTVRRKYTLNMWSRRYMKQVRR